MTVLLTLLHIVVCIILILVILLQAGRGQGLGGATFGSGNVQSLFGTRAADFLTKATSVSAVCFLMTCIGLNYFETRRSRSLLEGPRAHQAPVDMDTIRKALEKVKAEEAAKPAAQSAQSAAAAAGKTADSIPAAVNKSVQSAANAAAAATSSTAQAIPADSSAAKESVPAPQKS